MAKAKKISSHDLVFFDRLLLVALILSATAYIFRTDWVSPIFTIGGVFTSVLWSYRMATSYPNRNIRLGAAVVFSLLALVSIYYLEVVQGRI